MFWINLGTKKWASWLQAAGNNATNEYKPNRIIFLNSGWVYFSIRISSKRRIENFFVEPLVKSKLIPKWTGMPKWTISSLSWIAIQRKVDGFGRKWTLIGHKKMITECGWPINSKVDRLFLFLDCMRRFIWKFDGSKWKRTVMCIKVNGHWRLTHFLRENFIRINNVTKIMFPPRLWHWFDFNYRFRILLLSKSTFPSFLAGILGQDWWALVWCNLCQSQMQSLRHVGHNYRLAFPGRHPRTPNCPTW